MIEAKGHNGQIVFDGQHVTITRKGILARTSVGKGEKRWHISQISATQWKPAGAFINGFIQISAAGGNERRSTFGSQTRSAVQDENSVIFTRKQQAGFEQLRAAIDQAIAAQHAAPQIAQLAGVADQLAKLADLHKQGVITVEEFEAGKNRILGG
ncbi:DUF4429 domain-containing protein [Streptomyces sp. NPDC001858]